MTLTKLTLTKLAGAAMVAAIGFGAAPKPAEARDSFYIAYDNGPYYGAYYRDGHRYNRHYRHRHHNNSYGVYIGAPAYRYAYYDEPRYTRCYWRHGYRYCCDRWGDCYRRYRY